MEWKGEGLDDSIGGGELGEGEAHGGRIAVPGSLEVDVRGWGGEWVYGERVRASRSLRPLRIANL